MTREEFQLLNAFRESGQEAFQKGTARSGISEARRSRIFRDLAQKGWLSREGLTKAGVEALRPYRVDNAVIMAAGLSSRFVPLCLEKPKGLLPVKGEILIERQIRQLQEAGIQEIILVVGYRREDFLYLQDMFAGLKILVNLEYNSRNNTHTLYLARESLGNTYICSSDDYFTENPFDKYVYQSYYAADHVEEKTNEWYMIPDENGNIREVKMHCDRGDVMLGHAYWDRSFSAAMRERLDESHESGRYEQNLWEQIVLEHVRELPPMEIRVYPPHVIFEFDSLDELRAFDTAYKDGSQSRILQKLSEMLNCPEGELRAFRPITEGRDTVGFTFEAKDMLYTCRLSDEDSADLTISPIPADDL